MNKIEILLKGLFIGGTMMVPGISGGSMAMILGVYDRLISSVSSFFKNIKENLLFLILFGAGGGLGMLLLAKPLSVVIENYPHLMLYFFMGIVAGSLPMMYKKAEVKRIQIRTVLYLILGIALVLLLKLIPSDLLQGQSGHGAVGFIMLMIAGVVAAIALVLPGISVSYMLLVLGLYEVTIEAVSKFNFSLLIPLGLGLVLGVLGTTKLLETLMNKYPQPTYLMILGFMLGSVGELFPGVPTGMGWVFSIASFVAGSGIISIVLQLGKE